MEIQELPFDYMNFPRPEPIVIMTEESFNYLISYIDAHTLFFLFTISCFSTLICCTFRERERETYSEVVQESNRPSQISV